MYNVPKSKYDFKEDEKDSQDENTSTELSDSEAQMLYKRYKIINEEVKET